MQRIIVPTGYMGSGSSAITDLISEFKDCQNDHKSFEYVFLHCPNGLFDLEDKLLWGNNALRSDEAIRCFESQMKKLYDKKFWWVGNYKKIIGDDFMQITEKYINKIQQFNFDGFWYMHEEVDAKMFIKLVLLKPLKMIFGSNKFKKVLKYNDGMRISFIEPKDFYEYSSEYINELLTLMSQGNENIILDQLLLPFNLYRVDNYFDDRLKVIVVERDPRDVFIINKYIWNKRQLTVPFPTDVNLFCDFYKKMRQSEKYTNSKKVCRVRFEDLIYNYDSEVERISSFLGFDASDHINPKSRFNPDISIKNTQLFRKKEYMPEATIMKEKLAEYLYPFPYELNNDVKETVEFE